MSVIEMTEKDGIWTDGSNVEISSFVPKQKPGRSKQDYKTPKGFLSAIRHRLNISSFTVDLAADKANSVAIFFYDEEHNSLKQDWAKFEGWCWLNPPFTDINPWVKKAYEESQKGAYIAVLVPASVGSNWWRDYVEGKCYINYLNGRLAFMEDKPNWLYPKDCALLLYTPWGMRGSEVWTWKTDKSPKFSEE